MSDVGEYGTSYYETEALMVLIQEGVGKEACSKAAELVSGLGLQSTFRLKNAAGALAQLVQLLAINRTLSGEFTQEFLGNLSEQLQALRKTEGGIG